ncbi:tetraacyldisaccharide 4'-kinase [Belliella kenyensis]|uniref:Tetraacyldisaccharide 4'-kinase n=1 Tax=Belliella kenyensis TaxID=1472724 RepID=A0ABV8EK92_9BACT|nr:tetraacyldisaccharide 4'-kinase [Belliella kenyensis]MCH7403016.1 tetraacyldisaccharide 4'-kinase [Belliella kenyensis]MDN3605052.1 tetraacyldisaccharide 4'-kinase [Belliella kenyensis]
MRWFDPLLLPFSISYDLATRLRNHLFDIGFKKSKNFTVPTVVIGNLSMGGTGKTPFVEFLIELLSEHYQITTLSRGYGRKSKGYILADDSSTASQIGDEPFQIYEKYKEKINVAVGEKRVLAIPQILVDSPDTSLILLDDAFQHRYVLADYQILLTTYHKPFFEDQIVPKGTLRESMVGASRADMIIVTKCPKDLDEGERNAFRQQIRKYNQKANIIFVGIRYGTPKSSSLDLLESKSDVITVSGIANDTLFKNEASRIFQVKHTFSYTDHHHYTLKDINKIAQKCREFPNSVILTTEKDAVKLKAPIFRDYLAEIPIFAWPITIDIQREDKAFIKNTIINIIKEKDYEK